MSAPGGAPSPAPRSGSMGPGGGMSMPPQQPMTNAGPVTPGPPAPPPPPPGGPMSQQNLNQIVSHKFNFNCLCLLLGCTMFHCVMCLCLDCGVIGWCYPGVCFPHMAWL
ncbi:uncharacterized protein BO87DRAFT_231363 [Aspergillus neoniger CBS 115656]|uniref:Uncharacterized protein n=1 Tax=Aspergillus neoniger (strain CBS 115656) TaxID=1448310 RepID=A0A318YS72_ASPNB|nr:hypothetical protein BO87DRAFT_231363 [Aspergillus neoniger CBS 115656]PYH36777.1 hypothetical protein BO87DRAFT_231363 [Aspergillus neoniger CBS 115656]